MFTRFASSLLCHRVLSYLVSIKDELKCLFPERPLPCCDVFAIQTTKQPMKGHKLEESDWSVH